MVRQVHRLSAKTVEKGKQPGYYADGANLYLQISPSQSKSWIFRYTLHGKAREMGLGSARDVSLAAARGKAAEYRRQVVDGIDPIAARSDHRLRARVAKAGDLAFANCAEKYIASHKDGWRNEKHASQWSNTLETYAGPFIGQVPVKDIDTGLILRVLEPIWKEKPETATRVRGRIERILDWARTMGYRVGENPARWRGHLDNLLPAALNRKVRQHHEALPYDEIPAFLAELRGRDAPAARALEWLVLNASRTQEVLLARPSEVDEAKAIWIAPAAHMKGKKEHRVPLSKRALEIAKNQRKLGTTHLFPGPKEGEPMSNMAMLTLLRRMGRADITVHGFRSTFRDWAAECTTYPNEVCEMALAHEIGSKVEAAYRRGDLFEKRRHLMADWATYCEAPKGGAKVLPMKAA